MHDFLWFTISWHPFWFIVGLLVCIAIFIIVGPVVGMLVLALFLYNVTVWSTPVDWLPWLFTIAVVVGVVGVVLYRFMGSGLGATVAMFSAVVALVIALVLMNAHVFGWVDQADVDIDADVPGISVSDSDTLRDDLDDLRAKRVKAENRLNRRIDRLEADRSGGSELITTLKADINRLRGRVDAIQDLLDDHIHERVGQPHYVDR